MFEAVIFDLDGLMINSEAIQIQAWNDYLRRFEIELDDYEQQNLVGKRPSDIADYLYRRYAVPENPVAIFQEQQEIYNELLADQLEPKPGLFHVVEMFKDYGLRLAIGTTVATKDTVYDVTDRLGLDEAFDVIVAADMIGAAKPDPMILLACAETLALHPSYCLSLDSTALGVETAINAGMKVICVPGNYTARWKVGGADLVLTSLDSLNIPLVRSIWTDNEERFRPQPQLQPQATPSRWRR